MKTLTFSHQVRFASVTRQKYLDERRLAEDPQSGRYYRNMNQNLRTELDWYRAKTAALETYGSLNAVTGQQVLKAVFQQVQQASGKLEHEQIAQYEKDKATYEHELQHFQAQGWWGKLRHSRNRPKPPAQVRPNLDLQGSLTKIYRAFSDNQRKHVLQAITQLAQAGALTSNVSADDQTHTLGVTELGRYLLMDSPDWAGSTISEPSKEAETLSNKGSNPML